MKQFKRTKGKTQIRKPNLIRDKVIKGDTRRYEDKESLLKNLNPYQRAFVKEYLCNGWNQVQAYLKVYSPAYRDKTGKDLKYNIAAVNSTNLLKLPKIQQYLELIQNDFEKNLHISKARQLREYSKIAYSSTSDLKMDWHKLKDWDTLKEENPDLLDAIESIDTKTTTYLDSVQRPVQVDYVKIKFHNKIEALSKIDKLMGYEQPTKSVSVNFNADVDLNQYTPEEKAQLLLLARKNQYTEDDINN